MNNYLPTDLVLDYLIEEHGFRLILSSYPGYTLADRGGLLANVRQGAEGFTVFLGTRAPVLDRAVVLADTDRELRDPAKFVGAMALLAEAVADERAKRGMVH